jgi:hypothetical protein
MAKQKRQDVSGLSRMMLWVKANEKILFVLLLGAICVTFAFGDVIRSVLQSGQSSAVSLGFNRTIGPDEFQSKRDILPSVIRFSRPVLGNPPMLQTNENGDFSIRELLIYRGIALDMGIRISDEELQTEIKRLWRGYAAKRSARESLEKQGVVPQSPNDFSYRFRFEPEVEKNTRYLEKDNTFNKDDYSEMVVNSTRLRVQIFESGFRDVLLIKRLGDYIASTVALDPKDIYEEFRSERQRRKLQWLAVEIPDELKKKLTDSITDEEVKEHYNANRRGFRVLTTRVRFRWLRGDREPFVAQIEKEATEEQLKEYYEENRQRYVKPNIYPNAGEFALRSAEKQAARDVNLFKPFEEVKEEVSIRYARAESNSRLVELGTKLRTRLYPITPSAGSTKRLPPPSVTFEALAEEMAAVTTGYTEFATRQEAADTFGELYVGRVRTKINGWIADADKNKSYVISDSRQRQLRYSTNVIDSIDDDADKDLNTNEFLVYFTDVELRGPGIPSIEDLRSKIVETLVNRKLSDLVAAAIDERVKGINDGTAKFADQSKGSLEVVLASGDEFKVSFGEIEGSGKLFVQKGYYGRVMVPEKPDETKKKKKDDEEIDPNDIQEVVHDSSAALRDAVFTIAEPGEVGTAIDEENGVAYLVEFTERLYPDPGDFKTQRSRVESQLAAKRLNQVFSAWRDKMYAEGAIEFAVTNTDEDDSSS